jgi:hypothetical protein
MKMNGIYQLLASDVDVNIVGDTINTTNKSTEALIDDSKEVGLEANTKKTKYTYMFSRHQNAEQNYKVKIRNKSIFAS